MGTRSAFGRVPEAAIPEQQFWTGHEIRFMGESVDSMGRTQKPTNQNG
jgi:hypothetical protein